MIYFYWILNAIYNEWGMLLYEYLPSYILVLLFFFLTILYFICILITLKISDINKGIFFAFYVLLFYILIINPYNRGSEIEDLKELGLYVVDKINFYKQEKGHIPQKLEELYPNYLEEDEKDYIFTHLIYTYYDHVENNKLYELYPNIYEYMKDDTYSFRITKDFLFPAYISYNPDDDEFIVAGY